MHLYVLLLEGDKYYVGVAQDIGLRLWTHFKMGDQAGSAWTKKHPPLSVIHCSQCPVDPREFKRIEKKSTLRLAKLKGFSNVRGAGYSLTTDEYPHSWDEHLEGITPADMAKMTPLSKSEVRELMKGKYELWRQKRAEGRQKRRPKS